MEALARVDRLAGASALDACDIKDEQASSPVGKALGALVLAPLDVQSPSFLLTAPSHSQDIFRDHNRNLVSDGATANPKSKRCISNLVPISAHFRCMRGDSSLLPSVSRLGLIVPVESETLEIDSEDMESAFNHASTLDELLLFSVPRWSP